MKRSIPLLLAAFLLSTLLSVPVQAAEESGPGRDSAYYPISVEEYTYGDFDELRIQKVYQLSLDDDPSLIPTEDFERNGRLYYLLDMTRKDEVGVDTKPHVQTVTMPSDTNNMEKILQTLDAEIETVTEDGYTGKLHLDHTTVKVTTDGYATKDQNQNRAADHKRTPDAGDVDGFTLLNAGVLGSVSAAEHGGIGNHITAGFGNLSGVVRRHRVPGGVLTGGAADVPGRGGVAGDHTVTLLLGGIAPLHIRQGQAPPAIGDGLGHQGEVRIRQIRIGPGSGHGSGLPG